MEIEIENTELSRIVSDSGIQLNEAETIKQSYLPYFEQMAEIKEEAKKINFETPGLIDEKIARELRLRLVKIRTGSETIKNDRKKIHLLKGNLEQDAWNLIKSTCQLDEEMFVQVEKKREIEEKQRKEALRIERIEKLSSVCDNAEMYPLSEMSEDQFTDLFIGLKTAKEQKEAFELAEKERIEKERLAEIERVEAQRIENERLKKEVEEKERLHQEQLKKEREKSEFEAEQAKIKQAESDKLAKQQAEEKELIYQKQLQKEREEREKAELIAKTEAERLANIQAEEKAKQDEILRLEREEKQRLEDQLKVKEAEELRLKQEAEQADKLRLQTIEKAKKAPVKTKLKNWINETKIDIPPVDNETTKDIIEKFNSFKIWAEKQIENI